MNVARAREKRIWGIGASPGIAEGKAYLLTRTRAKFNKRYVTREHVDREIKRVREALEKSKTDLRKIKETLTHEAVHDHIFILESHLMILEDPMLLDAVSDTIATERKNAEWALISTFDGLKRSFNGSENEYLRERKSDFDYLCSWILKHLGGRSEESLRLIKDRVIVVSHYLSPADAAQMDREKVLAFVTDIGGKTSHTAILARAMKIPAVVGAEKATQEIQAGDRIILDGMEGLVVVNPTRETLEQSRKRKTRYGNLERNLLKERELPAETLEGRRIQLTANIEMAEEANSVLEYGAEGIGLYRTEFLCLSQGKIPTEEEHFSVYRSVVERVAPHPVNIRTFDFGSDKSPNVYSLRQESNPALGLRSIRYCLKEVGIFKDQLRGILRASHYGRVRILFPMVSGLWELQRAKEIYREAKEEVKRKGFPFDPKVEIGIMVEVPSAALIADVLAREVDFFSVGTNDLIQYCMAIDRVNKEVAYLYEPLHPSILRILKFVVEAGRAAGIHVGMCGEMASDPRYIFVLLGFGFDQLSMVSSMVPWVKRIIRSSRYEEARALVESMLQSSHGKENEKLLSDWMRDRFPEAPEVTLYGYHEHTSSG
ncbi:MAG: phosphoenolpyruvate--protein phosphotransferase [bacterium]